MKKLIFLLFVIIASAVLQPYVHAQETSWKSLYSSTNLAGHSIFAERNPGGGSDCPCSDEDVSLAIHSDYGEVIANSQHSNTWVNAIGYKKFIENFPDGSEIGLHTYKYTVLTRLPALPSPDANQQQNPESVHLMMQFYDGRNKFGKGSKISFEATVFWKLNPWVQGGEEGRIYVYTTGLQLIDTGLRIPPDSDWHKFTFEADFLNERFTSLTVDGNKKYLNIPLPRLSRLDWGDEIAFSITTESEPSWPKFDCQSIFYWNQYFKDIEFSMLLPCTGPISLTLTPSPGYTTKPMNAMVSGVSGCVGTYVYLKKDSCSGIIKCSSKVYSWNSQMDKSSCSFTNPSSTGSYRYIACLSGLVSNIVDLTVYQCKVSSQSCTSSNECCSGYYCAGSLWGGGKCKVVVSRGGGCPILKIWDGNKLVTVEKLNIHSPKDQDTIATSTFTMQPVNGKYEIILDEAAYLFWDGSHINSVKLTDETGKECKLISATHSKQGDVLSAITTSDDIRVRSYPGERIKLTYDGCSGNQFTFSIEGYNRKLMWAGLSLSNIINFFKQIFGFG